MLKPTCKKLSISSIPKLSNWLRCSFSKQYAIADNILSPSSKNISHTLKVNLNGI